MCLLMLVTLYCVVQVCQWMNVYESVCVLIFIDTNQVYISKH